MSPSALLCCSKELLLCVWPSHLVPFLCPHPLAIPPTLWVLFLAPSPQPFPLVIGSSFLGPLPLSVPVVYCSLMHSRGQGNPAGTFGLCLIRLLHVPLQFHWVWNLVLCVRGTEWPRQAVGVWVCGTNPFVEVLQNCLYLSLQVAFVFDRWCRKYTDTAVVVVVSSPKLVCTGLA